MIARQVLMATGVGAVLLVLVLVQLPGVAQVEATGECPPAVDVAFVIDDTASKAGAIANVQAEVSSIIAQMVAVSPELAARAALVTFKDTVVVVRTFVSMNNPSAVTALTADINALMAVGGNGGAEASDEALNTVVNNLAVADRPGGEQTGDFNVPWRPDAVKIAMLVTDNPPAGFDDVFTPGVDDVKAHSVAVQAQTKGIRIASVLVASKPAVLTEQARSVMVDYALTTEGGFVLVSADGSGTAAAIELIIKLCGVVPPPDPPTFPTPIGVGGIVDEIPDSVRDQLEAPGSSGAGPGVLAGAIASAVAVSAVTLGGAAWYVRRRRVG